MTTVIDERGRAVPLTPRRPGRCGRVGPQDAPCILQAGHDGEHRSLREAWEDPS